MNPACELKNIGWGFGVCNMKCRTCYSAACKRATEYSFEELKAAADKLCPHIRSINYGTGEFIFNAHVTALAEYIAANFPRIEQAVTSNGTTVMLLGSDKLKQMFHDIDISIDFPNPEKHNEMRRHDKAWKWAMQSLQICREAGIETSIVTCITSKTKDADIMDFLELAAKFGTSWRCSWFREKGRGKSDLRITTQRFWQIIKLLAKNAIFEDLAEPILEGMFGQHTGHSGCNCGRASCRIQSNGLVAPCTFLSGTDWSSGSLLEYSLEEIYNSEPFTRLRARDVPFCHECKYYANCRGGCASRAVLHSGALDLPDDFCPIYNQVEIDIDPGDIKVVKTGKVHSEYLCTTIVHPK
ncbi:MAG: radical SAM protein [Candidatus Parcubacteria bacterium]|nr:radical SAM protein [Candidatus Parcubacteria bacterium]